MLALCCMSKPYCSQPHLLTAFSGAPTRPSGTLAPPTALLP
jgi:hypothetical protein